MFLVKKVRFKNFRSFGNQFTEIELNKRPSTVIVAPNGSGKSSILMAIEFGLFGRVSNGINKNDLVNVINGRDLLVEIECSTKGKDVLVRRGIKPNIFEIYIDEELVNQEASVRDYQSWFEQEILGFSINGFRHVVSINGGTYTPFLLLSAGQRRKIVEELLNLDVFSKMHVLHLANIAQNKDDIQNTKSEIEKLEASLISLKKGLEKISEQEENYRKEIEENIKRANEKIENIKLKMEKLKNEKNELQSFVKIFNKKNDKKIKLKEYEKIILKQIQDINESISFFEQNENCPTCTQRITNDFKEQVIKTNESKKKKMEKSLSELKDLLLKTEKEIEELNKVLEKIQDLNNEILINSKRLDDLQNYIFEQKELLNKKTSNSEELKNEIKNTHEKIVELRQKYYELLEEKQYNEVISMIIKDDGIKSRIISQFIPKMNQEINRYLDLMDTGLFLEFNDKLEEKIYSRYKDVLSYSSFSAGERARIDIALLFTWREIAKLKNSLNCNLLFLDEIFDAFLDEQGLESFVNLLKYKLVDTNVFLISHRPEISEKFNNVLRIEKIGNFSRCVNL